MLGPIVVHQFTNALDRNLIETHIFTTENDFLEWLEAADTTLFLEFEPRDEVIDVRTDFDHCPGCGKRVADFEADGFENETGQRGHFACVSHLAPGQA